jgi:hypothetical protein
MIQIGIKFSSGMIKILATLETLTNLYLIQGFFQDCRLITHIKLQYSPNTKQNFHLSRGDTVYALIVKYLPASVQVITR